MILHPLNTAITRRRLLQGSAAFATGAMLGGLPRATANALPFPLHRWQRDERNPILPPKEDFDAGCCMNPYVLRRGDEYWMFYGGGDKKGNRRVCLATTPVGDLTAWKRHGPLFDLGGKGAFDEVWAVLPCVHRIGGKWHLYYTGRSSMTGVGLQGFWGMGLATSDDLRTWTKHSNQPILTGDGFAEFPNNRGIAGAGNIIELPQPDGRTLYRMYYTIATGTPSKDLRVDQAKQSVVAHTYDGLKWFDKRIVLQPREEADYENVATIGLNVFKSVMGYHAVYAAIGTRFGYYSICEAFSDDGLIWQRGSGVDENLTLEPTGDGWEAKMVEYPNIIEEDGRLRMFYCGNGYGSTGIGTAVADKLA